ATRTHQLQKGRCFMEVVVRASNEGSADRVVAVERQVFLIGRPPFEEFLGYVTNQTIEGPAADGGALAAEWRAANDHIRHVEQAEAGLADGVTTVALDATLIPLRDLVFADPIFQKGFSFVPADIVMVELDRLVVHQKRINLDHVARLRAQLEMDPSAEALF